MKFFFGHQKSNVPNLSFKQPTQMPWEVRLSILVISVFVVLSLMTLRLFQKQILEHRDYAARAESQYLTKKDIIAPRGKIYAHRSKDDLEDLYPLATNQTKYDVVAVPKNIKDKKLVSEKLSDILGIDKNEIFDKINNDKLYALLYRRTDEDRAQEIDKLKIEGIYLPPFSMRYYPEGTLASHILGFVNYEDQGNYGVEGYYNQELEGSGGTVEAEKDTFGRLVNIQSQKEAISGSDLILTLDENVQYFVEQSLQKAVEQYQADSGSVIIMDPKTGRILAMAGFPNFDPNKFNEVSADNQGVFLNPLTSVPWEPGSIFKPVVMSVAINENKVQPDTTGTFGSSVEVQGYKINTAQGKAFGTETMIQVLENSDNVAMVWVAEKLGIDLTYQYLEKYGFGVKTGIDIDAESSGSLRARKDWREINLATAAFGQGISTTPIQMLTAISAIANQGKLMRPYVVEAMVSSDGKKKEAQPQEVREIISPDTAKKITEMMVSVVQKGHGKKAQIEGLKVAGKTGTAQVPNPSGGYYEDRHIGSFAGFFPADNPSISMLVKLDQPKNVEWAEASAAPTFGEIGTWLANYYQIKP